VITKVGFHKWRKDGLVHCRWLESKRCILKGALDDELAPILLIDQQRKESSPPWIREPSIPSYHQL